MKIVCIADTHNLHKKLIIPKGDVLVHAGDISELGTKREIKSFLKWFIEQPHEHKIFIAGNHDFYLETIETNEFQKSLPENVYYLENSSITINGIKFWGTPQTPSMANWAFAEPFYWKDIPADTDVLISHIPPFDILDLHDRNRHLGDSILKKRVMNLDLKLHIFGHVHDSFGLTRVQNTIFINASSTNTSSHYINPPIIFDTSTNN